MSEIPEDLHPLQYGHWLAEQCGWPPIKTNIELLGGCVSAVARKKNLPLHKATRYIARAVKLAEEQGFEINRMFFMDAKYMAIRPPLTSRDYKPIDRKATEAEQNTPEFQEASRRAREALKRMVAKLDQTKGMSK